MALAIGLVSAAVLAFEIALMRMLLVMSWHHFAFVVISIALLGFGASGTALCILRRWLVPRSNGAVFALIVLTAVLIPLCSLAAQRMPIEARFVPGLLREHVQIWLIFWAILTVPFLSGASAVGLALMAAGDRVPTVYGANLAGSAAGCVLIAPAMYIFPPHWLPILCGAIALLAALLLTGPRTPWRLAALAIAVMVTGAAVWFEPPHLRFDPYKYGAYTERLEAQGSAERITEAFSPRSTIQVYRSDFFHDLPFLSVGAMPPPMNALVIDGHHAGSLLRIERAGQAEALDQTLMAVPYALLPPLPRVLLLGDGDGVNVWLAKRQDAAHIDVAQPDAKLVALLRRELRDKGGAGFAQPGMDVATISPRHFVDHMDNRYELIQLVTLQSLPAGSAGMGGLGEDQLVTVEGLAACLRRLAPGGIVAASRGMQTPPRDNIKLLATFIEALQRLGIEAPENHVVILRDYLGLCTMIKAEPWTPSEIERIREVCRRRELTPVWFTGIRPDELNRPDIMDGPEGSAGDWYHHAATTLFSPQRETFIRDHAYDIRPATDDRPFFLDFCRLDSLDVFREAYGELWLTRVELAFLFVIAAAITIAIAGALLTVLPLVGVSSIRRQPHRGATVIYFGAIGLGYLMLEMVCLSRLTHLIGDPVTAAALTIATFLLASGIGSMLAQRIGPQRQHLVRGLILGVALTGFLQALLLTRATEWAGGFPLVGRCVVAVAATAPVALLMGFPMPTALARLNRNAPPLVPWAWGINGFASVLAPPLTTIVGMTTGFRAAALAAVALYLLAAGLYARLPATIAENGIRTE